MLPDNPTIRDLWAIQYRVAPDAFALLDTEIGYDCAGAVQFVRPTAIDNLSARESGLDPLSYHQMTRRVQVLNGWRNNPPAAADDFVFRQRSLAGWQPKTGVRYDGQDWYEPYGNEPSTHIVKLDPLGYRNDAIIEFLCQTAARSVKIPAARCSLMTFGGIDTLVYERYDRSVDIPRPSRPPSSRGPVPSVRVAARP